MKHLISFFIFSLLCISTILAQTWQYANSFGGLPGNGTDNSNEPYNLVVDNDDNTYIYGNYGELTTFNDSTLIHYSDGRKGNFLVKYTCDGEVAWSKAIANTENRDESASWMEIKDDHIYLQGHIYMSPEDQIFFLDTLVDGADLLANFPDNNTYPWEPYRNYTYIIKLDLDGNIIDYHLLSNYRSIATPEILYGVFSAHTQFRIPFHIDNDGNFFLVAYLDNYQETQIICDDLLITEPLLPSETTFPQTYLLKFDSNFDYQWIKTMSLGVSDASINNTYIRFHDITNDNQNNLYIAGSLRTSTISMATYPVFVELENDIFLESCMKSYAVGFILKYDANGDLIWARQSKNYGEHSFSEFESIVVTDNNDIYIGGAATQVGYLVEGVGTIFGVNDTLTTDAGMASNYTGFIAKYDTEGNYHWAFSPNSFKSFISNICVYNDDIYTTVLYETSMTHGDSTYMYVHPNPPYSVRGLALCSWDSNGLPLESHNIQSSCYANNYDLAAYQTRISNQGNAYITGTLDSTLVFGDYPVSAGEDLKMFIAKYGTECPIVEVTESMSIQELYAYPVPATTQITFQIPNNKNITDFVIYDLQGKIVMSENKTCMQERITINIGDFSSGKYIIYLTTEDNIYTGSFIKQ